MDGKDAESVPWMAKYVRNPWPSKIVWVQDDVTHDRFYWLEIPHGSAKQGLKMVATVTGNEISLEGDVPQGIALHLADPLVDLDKLVTVKINGAKSFSGVVPRTPGVISSSLEKNPDSGRCPFAILRPNS